MAKKFKGSGKAGRPGSDDDCCFLVGHWGAPAGLRDGLIAAAEEKMGGFCVWWICAQSRDCSPGKKEKQFVIQRLLTGVLSEF
jgi:hypothetical protein